ncbi:MAG: hypothetical protein ACRD88_14090, partial [Terriglobia bacterium]
MEVEIGRLLPNQLHHLAPQMSDFARSYLGGFDDRLVERFSAVRDYSGKEPGKPTYDSIDVGQYLEDQGQAKRGLFLLHLRPVSESPQNRALFGDYGYRFGAGREDQRLILVTDLGF